MQVPERILVAGGNSHVAAKNLPRELQLENSVLSPSPEQVMKLRFLETIKTIFNLIIIKEFMVESNPLTSHVKKTKQPKKAIESLLYPN